MNQEIQPTVVAELPTFSSDCIYSTREGGIGKDREDFGLLFLENTLVSG